MDRSKWEYKKLRDICVSIDDGDWIESQDQSSEGIRLIQTGNIGIGEYLDKSDKSKYISEETFDRLKCKEIFGGDCLVSRLPDPIGRACILPPMPARMITAVDCSIIRFKKNVVPAFFVHFTKSGNYNMVINKFATGATRKRISRKNLESIVIPIPSLEDQQRIVAELNCLNEMIALKQEQLKEFDKLTQSIFYDMFGDPVANEKGWDINRLEENVTLINGRAYKQDELLSDGKYKVIRVGNFFSNSTYYYSDLELENDKYCEAGDLLYTWSASFGARIWEGEKVIYHYHIWKVNYDVKRYNKLFLCYLLNVLTEKFKENVHGVTMVHLTKAGMEKTEIPLPPLALQQEFAEKIQAIEAQKELVKKSIAETQDLLDYTMDKYFG